MDVDVDVDWVVDVDLNVDVVATVDVDSMPTQMLAMTCRPESTSSAGGGAVATRCVNDNRSADVHVQVHVKVNDQVNVNVNVNADTGSYACPEFSRVDDDLGLARARRRNRKGRPSGRPFEVRAQGAPVSSAQGPDVTMSMA